MAHLTSRELPHQLIEFARLFEHAVAIICYKLTCQGHRKAWGAHGINISMIDGAVVNKHFGIGARGHGCKNAASHGSAVSVLRQRRPNADRLLILEADYLWIDPRRNGPAAGFGHVRAFLASNQWQMLRVGYNPLGVFTSKFANPRPEFDNKSTACPAPCMCRHVAAHICAIERLAGHPRCDVRSAVAYAVHASAFDFITTWMNMSIARDNEAAQFGYHNDLWYPHIFSRLHYVVPPWVTDSGPAEWKRGFVSRARVFVSKCIV